MLTIGAGAGAGVLATILRNWKLITIGVTVLSTSGWMVYQNFRIKSLQLYVKELELDVEHADSEKEKCLANSEELKKKILREQELSKEFKTNIDKYNDVLQIILKDNKITIDKLRNEKTPQSCEDIAKYLRDGLESQEW